MKMQGRLRGSGKSNVPLSPSETRRESGFGSPNENQERNKLISHHFTLRKGAREEEAVFPKFPSICIIDRCRQFANGWDNMLGDFGNKSWRSARGPQIVGLFGGTTHFKEVWVPRGSSFGNIRWPFFRPTLWFHFRGVFE